MTKTPELLPCPFTGKKPDFIIYPIECGYKYEGKISVDGINLEIYPARRKASPFRAGI